MSPPYTNNEDIALRARPAGTLGRPIPAGGRVVAPQPNAPNPQPAQAYPRGQAAPPRLDGLYQEPAGASHVQRIGV